MQSSSKSSLSLSLSSHADAAKNNGPDKTGGWCAAAAVLAPRRSLPDLHSVGFSLFADAAAAGAALALAFALALALYLSGFP